MGTSQKTYMPPRLRTGCVYWLVVRLKILKKDLRDGRVTLRVETLDDVWHVKHLVDGGLDISVQTYKADCPPVALTKLPLIAGHEAVDMVISRMAEALDQL